MSVHNLTGYENAITNEHIITYVITQFQCKTINLRDNKFHSVYSVFEGCQDYKHEQALNLTKLLPSPVTRDNGEHKTAVRSKGDPLVGT